MNYRNILEYRKCNECGIRNICFLRKMPLYHYPENVQEFVLSIPQSAYTYQSQIGRWCAKYQEIQEWIVRYYDANSCVLSGNVTGYLSVDAQKDSDKKRIRELFKHFLDVAAKATEDKEPELSILFEGIGFVLASDYLEAVGKIFSMLKIREKMRSNTTTRCDLESSLINQLR